MTPPINPPKGRNSNVPLANKLETAPLHQNSVSARTADIPIYQSTSDAESTHCFASSFRW